MRLRSLALFALGSFAVSALLGCGGGTSGAGVGAPLVAGKVTARDGQTAVLGGIRVECLETRDSDTTSMDGRFEVEAAAGGRIRVRFDDPDAMRDFQQDCAEEGDPDPDGADGRGDEVILEEMPHGAVCEVEVELENGEITSVRVSCDHEERDGMPHEGESRLFPPDGSEIEAYGEVEVAVGEACCRMEVEVEGRFGDRQVLEVWIEGPDGGTERVGGIELREGRYGHMVVESCGGDPALPLGAGSCTELAGFAIRVQDLEGLVLLVGRVPLAGAHEMDGDHMDGDHMDGDGMMDGDHMDGGGMMDGGHMGGM